MAVIIQVPLSRSLKIPTNSPPSIIRVQPRPSYLWMNGQTPLMTDFLSWIWLELSWVISQPITITVAVQFRLLMDTRKSINGWILEVNPLLSEILRHSLNPCPIIRTWRGSDSIAPRLGKGFSILVSRTSSLLTGEMRTPVSSSVNLIWLSVRWLPVASFPRNLAIPQLLRSNVSATVPLVMKGRTAVLPHRGLSPHQFTPMSGAHHCVQATPDYALLFIVAQVSGVPESTSEG